MKLKLLIPLFMLVLLVGCAAGNPPSTNEPAPAPAPEPAASQEAPTGTEKNITMELSKFEFDPSVIEVNQGDTINLTLNSKDSEHGFSIDAYKVNVSVKGGETQMVTIKADQKGTFEYYCSVPCGSGHRDMKGQLIVK